MASVTAFIRTTKKTDKPVNVRFRLRDGRDYQAFCTSEIVVPPDKWDNEQQQINSRCTFDEKQRGEINKRVNDRKALIHEIYLKRGKSLTSGELESEIDKVLHPDHYEQPPMTFFEVFDQFLTKHIVSSVRHKNYLVVVRALQRFEKFTREKRNQRKFALDVNTMTAETLRLFSDFLTKEHEYCRDYPDLYETFHESRPNKPRGTNTLAAVFQKIRTFFNWCIRNGITANNPFINFDAPTETYGTPFYLTLEERNTLYSTDLAATPALERQRDIFIFQCVIGCRIGDLYRFTKANVIDGAIEYIAGKTREDKPRTLRVPLNCVATGILKKYADLEGEQLLPLISMQKYNDAIKQAFTVAGITRNVTVLNPISRRSEVRPINEVASSHLARRTFCGNLYKKVKDPNLVGSLSGHAEGSKAFARYRDIDEQMKRELVAMIE